MKNTCKANQTKYKSLKPFAPKSSITIVWLKFSPWYHSFHPQLKQSKINAFNCLICVTFQ